MAYRRYMVLVSISVTTVRDLPDPVARHPVSQFEDGQPGNHQARPRNHQQAQGLVVEHMPQQQGGHRGDQDISASPVR